MDSQVIKILRAQAWQRAKGELQSVLHTYFNDENFERMNDVTESFIAHVEEEGLVE